MFDTFNQNIGLGNSIVGVPTFPNVPLNGLPFSFAPTLQASFGATQLPPQGAPGQPPIDISTFDTLVPQPVMGIPGVVPSSMPFELNFDQNLISTATPQDMPRSKKQKSDSGQPRCTCHSTNCLKCYCVCFKAGRKCSKDCSCVNCKNRCGNEEEINAAIIKTKDSHPNAFEPKTSQNRTGCKCKKECKKNYCECKKNGFTCIPSCGCINCHNGKPGSAPVGFSALDAADFALGSGFPPQPLDGLTASAASLLQIPHGPAVLSVPEKKKVRPSKNDGDDDDDDYTPGVSMREPLRNLPPRKRIKPEDGDYYKDPAMENITDQVPPERHDLPKVEKKEKSLPVDSAPPVVATESQVPEQYAQHPDGQEEPKQDFVQDVHPHFPNDIQQFQLPEEQLQHFVSEQPGLQQYAEQQDVHEQDQAPVEQQHFDENEAPTEAF